MSCRRIAETLLWLVGLLGPATLWSQTVTTLVNFDGTNGGNAQSMSLVQGSDGKLYGTTWKGGANSMGVVFKVIEGTAKVLHTFSGVAPDGAFPTAGLLLASSGKLYGTTQQGGGGLGTVFSITPAGAYLTLHSFAGTDGATPAAPLIQSTAGPFYGTTSSGGTGAVGTAFKITAAGGLTTLYNLGSNGLGDGLYPFAPLVQGSDGSFYGATEFGGTNLCNCGTVFKVTPAGKEKVLYSFGAGGGFSDGAQPLGALIQGLDGNFYGTTSSSGCAAGCGGTVFKITPLGVLTTLHAFTCYPGDGCSPQAGLAVGSDGNLYGTTFQGGSQAAACNCGTIFQIAPDGTYQSLYSFTNGTDGRNPWGGLFQATDGAFYGTTIAGGSGVSSSCNYDGTQTCGTVFSLSLGLGPFVIDLPSAAVVGTTVKILGTNLMGATAVSFNGTPAVIVGASKTLITTSVPAGATSGYVTVTTTGGTLTSNLPFRVLP